jgi:hypothetical protein
MPTNSLYDTWMRQICELRPGQRITQIRNFVWLLIGIYQSRSVTLSRIAGRIPGRAKLVSTTRRLSRFLDNPALQVREWYRPIAQQWLQAQGQSLKEIRLIVDGTKVGFGHQLLMVSLAYRRRSIPIAWTWVKHSRTHSTSIKQLALLNYVRTLLPPDRAILLIGDAEFGSVNTLKHLEEWHWQYVLRQRAYSYICPDSTGERKPFGRFAQKPGQSLWLGRGYLTNQKMYSTNLLVHWQIGEEKPWCLATNLPDRQIALRYYRKRMWTEELHGDLKGHGFNLEKTMLQDFERLSRLTLAVAFLYVWLVSIGGRTIQQGLRHLVDRKDRRDLCIFQIGLRFIERKLLNASPIQIYLCSYL